MRCTIQRKKEAAPCALKMCARCWLVTITAGVNSNTVSNSFLVFINLAVTGNIRKLRGYGHKSLENTGEWRWRAEMKRKNEWSHSRLSGPWGREFKSRHSDQRKVLKSYDFKTFLQLFTAKCVVRIDGNSNDDDFDTLNQYSKTWKIPKDHLPGFFASRWVRGSRSEWASLAAATDQLFYRFTSSFFMPRSRPSTVSGYMSTTLAMWP